MAVLPLKKCKRSGIYMLQGPEERGDNGMFAVYSGKNGVDGGFWYSEPLRETFAVQECGISLWDALMERAGLTEEAGAKLREMVETAYEAPEPWACDMRISMRDALAGEEVPYCVSVAGAGSGRTVMILFHDLEREGASGHDDSVRCTLDELTGLLNRHAFLERLRREKRRKSCDSQELAVVYFDVLRFKVINHMFGRTKGDALLVHAADCMRKVLEGRGFGGRLSADQFVFCLRADKEEIEQCIEKLFDEITAFGLPFEILCNAGIYLVGDDAPEVDIIVDCAILAQKEVKGSYTQRFRYYSEELRRNMLGEQEITGIMRTALEEGQFVVYYQPQYNHATGLLTGAEALVRWQNPARGLIPPGQFITVFENSGFITELDQYVFEQVCKFLRKCLDAQIRMVPVSVNLTRYDLFCPGFIERLDEVRRQYEVPSKYIRIELTESSALGNSEFINGAVRKLHSCGYVVEMDDFGSGYSSLNILKDIDFDLIKLDMRFLQKSGETGGRGGTILHSVVRMLNWMQLPMIAEGVETAEAADYLLSIGCECVQGYLYSRPVPGEVYRQILEGSHIGMAAPHMKLIDTMNPERFWSEDSLETLVFSNYVGAAAVFEYRDGRAELLRVNKKYLKELCMNHSEKDVINQDILLLMEPAERESYVKMLERVIEQGVEQECETWRTISSQCCGEERVCIRASVRMLGKSKESCLFYALIRNITAEKTRVAEILNSERRFKAASEQANIYYWEYTVATREMRPCFRCMRDLGLPALLTNYPDSAIEMGVFPPEIADMYRDWHRQIAAGVPSLEAVLPLTVGRIPFHVRYTTEFDENGRPVKAYGSATLVVDQ